MALINRRNWIRITVILCFAALITPAFALSVGDVNGDGEVNVADATIILRCVVGLKNLSQAEIVAGDLNGDGRIDLPDATISLQVAVGLRSLPVSLPDGPLKIVALGDSLTQGDRDDLDLGGYPGRLIVQVDSIRPGSQMTNLGKSGWTSQNLIDGLDNAEGELPVAVSLKPDIALIWIGSNDLWYDVQYPGGQTEADTLNVYERNLDVILDSLKATGARLFIALLDDQSLRPFAKNPEIGLTDADRARMSRLAYAFNAAIVEKAKARGAVTVDFFHTTIFTDATTLADDGNHPNSKGYDLVTQLWMDAIRPVL